MEISPFNSRIEDEIGLPPRLRVAGDG